MDLLSALLPSEPVLSLETYFFDEGKGPTSTSDCCYVFVLDWYHTSKEG